MPRGISLGVRSVSLSRAASLRRLEQPGISPRPAELRKRAYACEPLPEIQHLEPIVPQPPQAEPEARTASDCMGAFFASMLVGFLKRRANPKESRSHHLSSSQVDFTFFGFKGQIVSLAREPGSSPPSRPCTGHPPFPGTLRPQKAALEACWPQRRAARGGRAASPPSQHHSQRKKDRRGG